MVTQYLGLELVECGFTERREFDEVVVGEMVKEVRFSDGELRALLCQFAEYRGIRAISDSC